MSRARRRSPALTKLLSDPDYLAEIIERYESGETLAQISISIDVESSWLGRVLRRNGCQMRPTGTRRSTRA